MSGLRDGGVAVSVGSDCFAPPVMILAGLIRIILSTHILPVSWAARMGILFMKNT